MPTVTPKKAVIKWVGKAPSECQLCNSAIKKVFVDGIVAGNHSWAIMCALCHMTRGCGLGTGLGQQYERKVRPAVFPETKGIADWVKVAG